jgi:hypothetical protein
MQMAWVYWMNDMSLTELLKWVAIGAGIFAIFGSKLARTFCFESFICPDKKSYIEIETEMATGHETVVVKARK